MFKYSNKIISRIKDFDYSKDKETNYKRILYIVLYHLVFNQIEIINVRKTKPKKLIIPLEVLGIASDVFLNKFKSSNESIIVLFKEEQIIKLKHIENDNIYTDPDENQRTLLKSAYMCSLQLYHINTLFIQLITDIVAKFINIFLNSKSNPVQIAALVAFVESTLGDLENIVIKETANKQQNLFENNELMSNCVDTYIDNHNIIYECCKENEYIDNMINIMENSYDISSDYTWNYHLNKYYNEFDKSFQRKLLILTFFIPKNQLVASILGDIRSSIFRITRTIIIYDEYTYKLKSIERKLKRPITNNTIEKKSEQTIIDISLLNNGILFYLNNISLKKDKRILFTTKELTIPSGKWILLSGNSGCGKTTFCNMLIKKTMTDDNSRIVLLDTYDNYDYNSIRKYISVIKPSKDLFNDSIFFNLTFGVINDDINDLIKKYLTLFEMTDIITNLNNNIMTLSTGEQQRIKIIRCILQDKPIWFLDEITSNVDSNCEKIIMKTLRDIQILKNKSVIHITHNVELANLSDYRIIIQDQQIDIISNE